MSSDEELPCSQDVWKQLVEQHQLQRQQFLQQQLLQQQQDEGGGGDH